MRLRKINLEIQMDPTFLSIYPHRIIKTVITLL